MKADAARFAVVGLSCLFPGASSPDEYWRNLMSGTDSRRDGSEQIFGPPGGDPPGRFEDQHKVTSTRGGFLDEVPFDPSGYLLPPSYLDSLDDVFRWSLRVAGDALRDGGYALADGAARSTVPPRTGVILGNASFPTDTSSRAGSSLWWSAVAGGLARAGFDAGDLGASFSRPGPAGDPAAAAHNLWVGGMPPRVVAAALGLDGPSFAIDAACASALYAIKLACDQLAAGAADMMLAGAVCAADPLVTHLTFSDLHAYPSDGYSQPFDAASGGVVTSQGAGMVLLKRLADALADGDHIHAVVEGIGVTNDSSGRHALAPTQSGQTAAYEHAYRNAGIDPATVQYLECHATGTSLGDGIELAGIERFFGPAGRVPYFGSVKSNVGHLLTAAGMPALLKVILGMRHGSIPATVGVRSPIGGSLVEQRLVRATMPWPDTDGPRRAAVSSFGFGGTNAHLVLTGPPSHAPSTRPGALGTGDPKRGADRAALPRLDIVGLGCHVGPFADVDQFERAVHAGRSGLRPPPERRWRGLDEFADERVPAPPDGGYLDGLDLDLLGYRIPPNDIDGFNEEQALIAVVAEQALMDAGYTRPQAGQPRRASRRVAVVVAADLNPYAHSYPARYRLGGLIADRCAELGLAGDAEAVADLVAAARHGVNDGLAPNAVLSFIGNLAASRIASLWNFTGPALIVSEDSSGAASALQIAQLLLLDDSVEAVLVGAVQLGGDLESTMARARLAPLSGEPGLGIGGAGGWRAGEGAAAVVVTRPGETDGRVYATIDALVSRHSPGPGVGLAGDAETVYATARQALTTAGIEPQDVQYIEMHSAGVPEQDRAEIDGLARLWPADRLGRSRTAIGAAAANVGDTQLAGVLVGVIKAALCLHHAYLPAVPAWGGPDPAHAATLESSAFYVPAESRPWLRASREEPRRAVVNGLGTAGNHVHLVLSGATVRGEITAQDWARAGGPFLLALSGSTPDQLTTRITAARDALLRGDDPRTLAGPATEFRSAPHRAVFCSPGADGLVRELESGLRELPDAYRTGREWTTPSGSCFAPSPFGNSGKIALVYPGLFSSYAGLGADLFRYFPGLLPMAESQGAGPAGMAASERLYRRDLRPAAEGPEPGPAGPDTDFASMVRTSVMFSWLHTQALRGLLGVPVQGALGYSLGESSMMCALGAWTFDSPDETTDRLAGLVNSRLAGSKPAVREAWGIPAGVPDADVWTSLVLFAAAEAVRTHAGRYDRVFVTQINTPGEVVIAGDPESCRALVAELGCLALPAGVDYVLHCPIADPADLADCLRRDTKEVSDVELFSVYDYSRIDDFSTDRIVAGSVANLRDTVDFPRLVRHLYDRGYRYFVEVGPGAACTRWVRETLAQVPHVAESLDRRGADAGTTYARVLARLAAHHVDVDLSALCPPPAGSLWSDQVTHRIDWDDPAVVNSVAQAAGPVVARLQPSSLLPPRAPETPPADPRPPEPGGSPAIVFDGEPARGVFLPPLPYAEATVDSRPPKRSDVLYDRDDLMEFAIGKVANVFGPAFSPIDEFSRRIRLPAPPYFFLDRIVDMQAETGRFEPSFIRSEYDVPSDAWYLAGGQMPFGVASEASQASLVLASYLGLDFEHRGERVYRLLDGNMVARGPAVRGGQCLRFDIWIDRFIRTPGGPTLYNFRYKGYADDQLAWEFEHGLAGFFTTTELAEGKGIVGPELSGKPAEPTPPELTFKPVVITERTELRADDVVSLARGEFEDAFGPGFGVVSEDSSLRLPANRLLMIDEVVRLSRSGGRNGRGAITSIKRLTPDDWIFKCHFPDDPVMGGTLIGEGAVQVLQVYALSVGLHLCLPETSFQPLLGLTTLTKIRGQIGPTTSEVRYELDIVDIGLLPRPYLIANVLVYADGKPVGNIRNLGFELREKPGTPYRPEVGGKVRTPLGRRTADGRSAMLGELHLAHVARGDHGMLGPEYDIYQGRKVPRLPSGDFCFADRMMSFDGERGALQPGATMVCEYDVPADSWYFGDSEHPYMPNFALMEASLQTAPLLAHYGGATLQSPQHEFQSRNLSGEAVLLHTVDLRGKTIQERSVLESIDNLDGFVLQRYRYELSVDGLVFYRGESAFCFAVEKLLDRNVGLDAGRTVTPWLERGDPLPAPVRTVDLAALRHRATGLRMPAGRLNFLDHLDVVTGGGEFGAGYLHGHRVIQPDDWYFRCHFHRDPVMPGSLGVETVLDGLRAYVIDADLAEGMDDPVFTVARGVPMRWAYRGQIVPDNLRLNFEAHVKEVRREAGRLLVIADASVWKAALRIYALNDVAIEVVPAKAVS